MSINSLQTKVYMKTAVAILLLVSLRPAQAVYADEDVENVARFYASQDGLFTPATED